jgi:hypothetical protein
MIYLEPSFPPPPSLSYTEAYAASGRVWSTASCAAPARTCLFYSTCAVPERVCVSVLPQSVHFGGVWPTCSSLCFRACAALVHVCLQKLFAAPGRVCIQEPVLQSMCWTCACLSTEAFCCTWTCLHTRACPSDHVLHLCMSVYRSFLLHLDVSVYKSLCFRACAALVHVRLQKLLLHLDVSANKSLCCTSARLSTEAFAAPGRGRGRAFMLDVSIYKSFCAQPGRVCLSKPVLHLCMSVYKSFVLHLDMSAYKSPAHNYPWFVSVCLESMLVSVVSIHVRNTETETIRNDYLLVSWNKPEITTETNWVLVLLCLNRKYFCSVPFLSLKSVYHELPLFKHSTVYLVSAQSNSILNCSCFNIKQSILFCTLFQHNGCLSWAPHVPTYTYIVYLVLYFVSALSTYCNSILKWSCFTISLFYICFSIKYLL